MKENRPFGSMIREYLPVLMILMGALVLMYRASCSFCYSDETFYFSTTHRFISGDSPFVHEWFPTQMVSLILMPFQAAYRQLTGSYDGLILYFRILYVVYESLVALFIFRVIKKHSGVITAVVAALFFQFYTHLNIATLSYYTISVSMLLIALLLIFSEYDGDKSEKGSKARKRSDLFLVLSGSALSLSVLSLPTLAAAYFIAVFFVLVTSLFLKTEGKRLRRVLFLNFCGIVPVAVLVLIYLYFVTGIGGIVDNLTYILSDEEHTQGLIYPFKNFFLSVFDVFGREYVAAELLLALLGLIYSFREKLKGLMPFLCHPKVDPLYVKGILLSLDACLYMYAAERGVWPHTGFTGTMLCLFALPLFMATENDHKQVKLFFTVFIGGLVFSMVFSYSSMCDLYVISIGHNLAAVAGIVFSMRFIDDLRRVSLKKNGLEEYFGMISPFVLAIALFTCVSLRLINIYRDAPSSMLKYRIDSGVAKGLYTTCEHKAEYESLLKCIRENTGDDSDTVLFTKLLPWGYLESEAKCASYTTWRVPLSSERLREYHEVHPERIPTVIILLDDNVGSYETCGDVEADPSPNLNEKEGYVWELINDPSYEMTRYDHCTVYKAVK
ncbi:MAG: hypothetical protein IKR56_02145 [Lachnospiraceae bacterium]|nr:hypothetical protein [Lachnospiraceae bacterium]